MSANAANAVVLELETTGPGPAAFVKDSIDVAGAPTRCGTPALADALVAQSDAAAVRRLRAAGWRIAGKTWLHELAFGTTGVTASWPSPLNPRWPALVPGGSSTGSAVAVASGEVKLALGTDTGGSIRVPAACCGVYGLKPTFGLVDRQGVMPRDSSLDCVGPLALDMATLCDAMGALVPGFTRRALPPVLRIGILRVRCDEEAALSVESAIAAWEHVRRLQHAGVDSAWFEPAFVAGIDIINHETWSAWGPLLRTGLLGLDVAARLEVASRTTAEAVAAAEKARCAFTAEIDALLDSYDLIALPTIASLPPRIEDARRPDIAAVMTSLVRPFNLSGHPAISIPVRSLPSGPYSLQLVARRGQDDVLCTAAEELALALYAIDAKLAPPQHALR